MKILENYNLKDLNTFGVSAVARYFVVVENENDLKELFDSQVFKENKRLFIGGGSNILFTKDYEGLVVHNQIKGIKMLGEDGMCCLLNAKSGEDWHSLVEYTTNRGHWGIENLAKIPGTVGAAPMQNIGAYGAEIRDVLVSLEAVSIATGEKKVFGGEECKFGYRESVFKKELKDRYFITGITICLQKNAQPNIEYKALKEYFESKGVIPNTPKEVSDAVSEIRGSKLPDPKKLGNAGSFFKNVYVSEEKLNELLVTYPDLPHFKDEEGIKIPSAWLIETAGWRGKNIGNSGVHERHALVLVNHGEATGAEIKALAQQIIDSVEVKFGITLSPEVNFI